MCCKLQRNNESCKEVEGVLNLWEKGQRMEDKENKKRAFRKGRPRFVVFIMCEEEAWGVASSCIVKMEGESERRDEGESGVGGGAI